MRAFAVLMCLSLAACSSGPSDADPTPTAWTPSPDSAPARAVVADWPPSHACNTAGAADAYDLCVRVGGLMKFDGNALYAAQYSGETILGTASTRIRSGLADIVMHGTVTGGPSRLRFYVDHDGDFGCTNPTNDFVVDLELPATEHEHLIQTRAVALRQRSLDEGGCSDFFHELKIDVPYEGIR